MQKIRKEFIREIHSTYTSLIKDILTWIFIESITITWAGGGLLLIIILQLGNRKFRVGYKLRRVKYTIAKDPDQV